MNDYLFSVEWMCRVIGHISSLNMLTVAEDWTEVYILRDISSTFWVTNGIINIFEGILVIPCTKHQKLKRLRDVHSFKYINDDYLKRYKRKNWNIKKKKILSPPLLELVAGRFDWPKAES